MNAPKQNRFAIDSSQSLPITCGVGTASGKKSLGNCIHTGRGTICNGWVTDEVVLGRVLLIPCLGHFMWPFTVAGLGLRYLRIKFALRLGHPLRKPFCTAFSNVEIFGLHND